MRIVALDHVQLAIPPDGEELARRFWTGPVGFEEEPKPQNLRAVGGLWLRSGRVSLHLGIEVDFRPAKKAHPAFAVDDIDTLADRLRAEGYEPRWDTRIETVRRFFVNDPFGNRVEFLTSAP